MSNENVRVRYAPSPTGIPHVGNIRTALFNWLFARHSGGKFIVRIEDTDQSRKVDGAVEAILDSLRWLGMDWDEGPEAGGDFGPYFQSQRLDMYRKYAQQLIDGGHAYRCYCSSERLERMRAGMAERKESMRSYDRHCRNLSDEERAAYESQSLTPVVRFKVPLEGRTTFHDIIRGDITFDNGELDDLVLLKSDGFPTYHLANIVDDHFMEINHIMRADEWLSSTPRHVLLYAAFGWEPPVYAHLPMILGLDKSKLSKRHGATSLVEYCDMGYLPEAMLNFLALLGWALDDKTEIMSRDELIKYFSVDRVSKTAAVFSQEKLGWMNGVYIRELSIDDFVDRAMPFLERDLPPSAPRPIDRDYVARIAPLIQERVKVFGDVPASGDMQAVEGIATQTKYFFVDDIEYDAGSLLVKKIDKGTAISSLKAVVDRLQECAFDHESLESALRALADELGMKPGVLFGPIRIAVTGRAAAPPLFQTMEVLGRDRCLKRVSAAVDKLSSL
ncbi:MAG: glutamate--tRNA ligase [Chloroflexota bacterium]|nr:glutamate--tRNA ligase [Chloroflexota bacterium]